MSPEKTSDKGSGWLGTALVLLLILAAYTVCSSGDYTEQLEHERDVLRMRVDQACKALDGLHSTSAACNRLDWR